MVVLAVESSRCKAPKSFAASEKEEIVVVVEVSEVRRTIGIGTGAARVARISSGRRASSGGAVEEATVKGDGKEAEKWRE